MKAITFLTAALSLLIAAGSIHAALFSATLVSPTTNTIVASGSEFTFSSQVVCSGSCGEVQAWLEPMRVAIHTISFDPYVIGGFVLVFLALAGLIIFRVHRPLMNKLMLVIAVGLAISGVFLLTETTGLAAGSFVSTEPGAVPFYTNNPNPQSCGQMSGGDTCTNTWNVHTTGEPGDYQFYVLYNSTQGEAETERIIITVQ